MPFAASQWYDLFLMVFLRQNYIIFFFLLYIYKIIVEKVTKTWTTRMQQMRSLIQSIERRKQERKIKKNNAWRPKTKRTKKTLKILPRHFFSLQFFQSNANVIRQPIFRMHCVIFLKLNIADKYNNKNWLIKFERQTMVACISHTKEVNNIYIYFGVARICRLFSSTQTNETYAKRKNSGTFEKKYMIE